MIGIVGYGIAIALLDARLPGHGSTWHGVLIAVAGWMVMMVVLMPMAGAGMFGMAMGPMAPIMTLVLHLILVPCLAGPMAGWRLARRRTLRAQPLTDRPRHACPSGETMTATRKGYFEALSYLDSNRGVDALNA